MIFLVHRLTKMALLMPDLINIRLTKDSPAVEAMDEAASKMGMSRNEMILKAIGMMISFDKVFYKKLEIYSEKMKVPMWTALQSMTIKRWHRMQRKHRCGEVIRKYLLSSQLTRLGQYHQRNCMKWLIRWLLIQMRRSVWHCYRMRFQHVFRLRMKMTKHSIKSTGILG